MTVSDLLHLAFGAAAGVVLVAMAMFARESAKANGAGRAIGSLVASLLALILLIAAAAQLNPVLLSLQRAATPAAPVKAGEAPQKTEQPASGVAGAKTPDKAEPKPLFPIPKLEAKTLLPAVLLFVSSLAFLAALVGGMAAALLVRVTRDDPSEEESEQPASFGDALLGSAS
jgi:hypothetical protein